MSLEKEAALRAYLHGFDDLAIAYSGGVDSAYLADVAHEVLGKKCVMVIADSPSIPRTELQEARDLATKRGWNLRVIQTSEHKNEAYLKNTGDRCYHCKKELFSQMSHILSEIGTTTLAHGAIEDDRKEIRHGSKAATEHQVVAPLQEAHLYKKEIRELSKRRNLPTWEKASFACLGSRFPTGMPIDLKSMSQIERAEDYLRQRGFVQYRVRHHGDICRIEIDPLDFDALMLQRDEIINEIKSTGYRYVTLDLSGYSTGSTA